MSALVVDIETAGEDWSQIDEHTKKVLTERISKYRTEEENPEEVAENELGMTPFTGQIVALGVLDCETSKGAVYYQAGGKKVEDKEENGIKFHVGDEKEILEKFWELADRYTHFITYSGRTFDMPYIMIRSAILGIRPGKDLMRNRYINLQAHNAYHIDLYDQLKFYGSFNGLGGLHLACRAFGIETPKDGEIDGSLVGEYYKKGKYMEIAEYNSRDLFATAELYAKWRAYLAF